jgi:hypothetical protein
VKNYVYTACNPTILNLSNVEEKISLDYRPKVNCSSCVLVVLFSVYFVVTSADLLVVFVCFLFNWV